MYSALHASIPALRAACCYTAQLRAATKHSNVLLCSTATCCFAKQQRAASQHSNVLLRSTAKCCFAAQQRAASQHSAACCAQPSIAANSALACNAALCSTASQNRRISGILWSSSSEHRIQSVRDQNRKTTEWSSSATLHKPNSAWDQIEGTTPIRSARGM